MTVVEITEQTCAFIAEHRHEDVRDLALHARHDASVDLPFALEQISGWQRARVKLPDWAGCEGVIYPPQVPMEQCSSQFTAQYKARVASRLMASSDSPTSLVDMTGGFGVDFSYMARVFDTAIYVERRSDLCDIARHNLPLLGLPDAEIINGDSTEAVRGLDRVSMIFADPARRDDHGSRTYAIADCTPDVLALKDLLLGKASAVMIKLSPMLDWHKTVADFSGSVHEVHIVSTGNECKELLLVLGRDRCDAPRVVCVNDDQMLEFVPDERGNDSAIIAAESTNRASDDRIVADEADWQYLYEPNASIMKAGCFDEVERRFNVRQIGPNSHLFVSGQPIGGFPGRSFVIETVTTMNKHDLNHAMKGLTHANITVRNFPMPVAGLRRKLRLKDGGSTYLFATTDAEGHHIIIRTIKQ